MRCGELLNASWLGTHNTEAVTISDILKMSFLFDCSIDASLWTIRPVFIGSCIVYLVSFLLKRINLPEYYWGGIWIILFLLSIIKYTIGTLCVSCCILGAAIPYLWERIRIPQWLSNFFILLVILLVSGIHQWSIERVIELGVDVPVRFGLDGYGDIIYSAGLLLLINRSNILKRVLSFKTSYSKSSMSFSIYIFHMPLIMSVSALICMKLYNHVNYTVNCLINITISTLVVGGVSYIYTRYVDKYQNRLLKKVDELLIR